MITLQLSSSANADAEMEAQAETLRAIRSWVRELWVLKEEDQVLIKENLCLDPDCAGCETVIGIFPREGASSKFRLNRPLQEITREVLAQFHVRLTSPKASAAAATAASISATE